MCTLRYIIYNENIVPKVNCLIIKHLTILTILTLFHFETLCSNFENCVISSRLSQNGCTSNILNFEVTDCASTAF